MRVKSCSEVLRYRYFISSLTYAYGSFQNLWNSVDIEFLLEDTRAWKHCWNNARNNIVKAVYFELVGEREDREVRVLIGRFSCVIERRCLSFGGSFRPGSEFPDRPMTGGEPRVPALATRRD